MVGSQYFALLASYATAVVGWLLLWRAIPGLWPPSTPPFAPQHPWREVGWAPLAAAAVLGIGQLWGADRLLPRQGLCEVANQLVIFSLVALLFALAHVPALVQSGISASNLGHLILDAALGIGILTVLRRSADVWWFWMVTSPST